MTKSSVLVLNRWNDSITRYDEYIDHNKFNVFYITNEKGSLAVSAKSAAGLCVLNDINIENIDTDASDFLSKISNIKYIIALSEVDQEVAAYLRSCLLVPGLNNQNVKRFRDKIIMKNTATLAGILVPKYIDMEHHDVFNFLETVRFPVVFKPKNGVSSEGVLKVNNHQELKIALEKINWKLYECEEFVDGKIFHVDGIIYNDDFIFFKVSEYISSCLDYTFGSPVGSVIVDDINFECSVKEYTKNVLKSFGLNNGAFHFEFIANNQEVFYFIELGARVGGAKIPYLFEKIFNINLIHTWIDIQFGNNVFKHIDNISNKFVGGFLLFPEPKAIPCLVAHVNSLKTSNSMILEENLPAVGHVFNGNGEYRDISGSYLLRGENSMQIKEAINEIINNFSIETILIN